FDIKKKKKQKICGGARPAATHILGLCPKQNLHCYETNPDLQLRYLG
ncbi:MAG: hypothetical protein RLZZ139_3117, partial [Cyanobacteriota bacterium]